MLHNTWVRQDLGYCTLFAPSQHQWWNVMWLRCSVRSNCHTLHSNSQLIRDDKQWNLVNKTSLLALRLKVDAFTGSRLKHRRRRLRCWRWTWRWDRHTVLKHNVTSCRDFARTQLNVLNTPRPREHFTLLHDKKYPSSAWLTNVKHIISLEVLCTVWKYGFRCGRNNSSYSTWL